jgi:hypothetical protein
VPARRSDASASASSIDLMRKLRELLEELNAGL